MLSKRNLAEEASVDWQPLNLECNADKSLSGKWLDSFGFLLGARIHRVNQVAEREQRDAQDGAQQIQIMANTILGSATYSREDTKCFEHVSKNNDDKRRCAKQPED